MNLISEGNCQIKFQQKYKIITIPLKGIVKWIQQELPLEFSKEFSKPFSKQLPKSITKKNCRSSFQRKKHLKKCSKESPIKFCETKMSMQFSIDSRKFWKNKSPFLFNIIPNEQKTRQTRFKRIVRWHHRRVVGIDTFRVFSYILFHTKSVRYPSFSIRGFLL